MYEAILAILSPCRFETHNGHRGRTLAACRTVSPSSRITLCLIPFSVWIWPVATSQRTCHGTRGCARYQGEVVLHCARQWYRAEVHSRRFRQRGLRFQPSSVGKETRQNPRHDLKRLLFSGGVPCRSSTRCCCVRRLCAHPVAFLLLSAQASLVLNRGHGQTSFFVLFLRTDADCLNLVSGKKNLGRHGEDPALCSPKRQASWLAGVTLRSVLIPSWSPQGKFRQGPDLRTSRRQGFGFGQTLAQWPFEPVVPALNRPTSWRSLSSPLSAQNVPAAPEVRVESSDKEQIHAIPGGNTITVSAERV